MTGLPRRHNPTLVQSLLSFTGTILGLCIISALLYHGVGWTKDVFGEATTPIVTVALLVAYVALIRVSSKHMKEGNISIDSELTEVPEPGPTIKSLVCITFCLSLCWFGV
jgi:hypothetical protein